MHTVRAVVWLKLNKFYVRMYSIVSYAHFALHLYIILHVLTRYVKVAGQFLWP